MSPQNNKGSNLTLLFLVSVSFLGLILAVFLAVYPPVSKEDLVWRKPLVGVSFAAVSVFGIIAVFFPNQCSRSFDLGKREKHPHRFFGFGQTMSDSSATALTLRGHHPMCGRFSAHVYRLRGTILCATCSGLFLGATIVLAGVGLYFFGNLQMGSNAFVAVLAGVLGVVLGLLQSPLPLLQSSFTRLFSSAFFVVGTFLILAGIEELARNVSVDLLFVALSVFWLLTRIALSQWDHERICSECTLDSCSL